MMLSPFLSILVLITFLPIFSSATTPSFNCYKYEQIFGNVNFTDVPVEEKKIVKCDKCFGYICYQNDQYILGNGCREDLLKSCNLTLTTKGVINGRKNKELCYGAKNLIFDLCLKDSCNHESLKTCISTQIGTNADKTIGPEYTFSNITLTEIPTPIQSTINPDNGNGNGNNPSSANSKMIPSILFFGIFIFAYFI